MIIYSKKCKLNYFQWTLDHQLVIFLFLIIGILNLIGAEKSAREIGIDRQISPQNLLESIKNPLETGPIKYDSFGRPSQKLIGSTTTIIINPENRSILTLYPTSTSVANRLLNQVTRDIETNSYIYRPR